MIKFHKMHGLGNDFVLIDNRQQNFLPEPKRIRQLANRRTGIGCDQVLLLNSPELASSHLDFRIFNADGSEAEQCGNGMRCIAMYLARTGEINQQCLQISGCAGPVEICWQQNGTAARAKVNMGQPIFAAAQIPMDTSQLRALDNSLWQLELADLTLNFYAVSMGNPHLVVLAEEHPGITLETMANKLAAHPAFPGGVNIGLIKSFNRTQITLQVHERGSGQTRACGSGACAAMAALRQAGKVDSSVTIYQAGGELNTEWPAIDSPDQQLKLAPTGRNSNNDLWMSGPAAYVFQGETDDS